MQCILQNIQGRVKRFCKRGRYVGHHGWPMKKLLGFRWSKKVKITLEAISFLAKYFFQYFQILYPFTYNENLPMKSYQFSKICKRFYQERKITLIPQSMRKKRKLRKVGISFITGWFIKTFKMIINHFFFIRSFCSQDFFLFCNLVHSVIFAF